MVQEYKVRVLSHTRDDYNYRTGVRLIKHEQGKRFHGEVVWKELKEHVMWEPSLILEDSDVVEMIERALNTEVGQKYRMTLKSGFQEKDDHIKDLKQITDKLLEKL